MEQVDAASVSLINCEIKVCFDKNSTNAKESKLTFPEEGICFQFRNLKISNLVPQVTTIKVFLIQPRLNSL